MQTPQAFVATALRAAAGGRGRPTARRSSRRAAAASRRRRRPAAAQDHVAGRPRGWSSRGCDAPRQRSSSTSARRSSTRPSCGSAPPTRPACRAFTLMGVLGGLAARGEPHERVWELLGVEPPDRAWRPLPLLRRRAAVPRARCARSACSSAPSATRRRAPRSCSRRPDVDFVGVLRALGRERSRRRSSSRVSSTRRARAGARSPTSATASTTT